jgi:hypothetical protein
MEGFASRASEAEFGGHLGQVCDVDELQDAVRAERG